MKMMKDKIVNKNYQTRLVNPSSTQGSSFSRRMRGIARNPSFGDHIILAFARLDMRLTNENAAHFGNIVFRYASEEENITEVNDLLLRYQALTTGRNNSPIFVIRNRSDVPGTWRGNWFYALDDGENTTWYVPGNGVISAS